jgi:ceramide glucosyltransferase
MWLLALPAAAAAAYWLLALVAAWRWKRRPIPGRPDRVPGPVSILKPVHGRDPRFYEGILSHATQDYPEFEILFGVGDPHDAALEDIARLAAEFPERPIRVVVARPTTPNAKVGVLQELARAARYDILLVNDSDIVVEPGYLRAVCAPLSDASVGVVTCLYRAEAESLPGRWEALGVATEFTPSVLVARLIGVAEFVLGSTMVFRKADLERAGGFAALGDYLADDYQLGLHITELGRHVAFADAVVETSLGAETFAAAWRHQVRWSRTIRVSRPGGYYGYGVTHATVWAILAALAGYWPVAVAAVAARLAAGMVIGAGILRDHDVLRQFWAIPIRDLWGFGIWLSGAFGHTVDWRGERLRLASDGRLTIPAAGR